MKYLKILGLAAVAAMALMAVVGAGSASATELCQENVTTPCPDAKMVKPSTTISSQLKAGTVATLTSSLGNIVCKKSTVGGKTTETNGMGEITSMTFSECALKTSFGGEHSCTISAVGLPATGSISSSATMGNGTMTVTPKGATNPGARAKCAAAGLDCTFQTASIALDVIGGNPAIVKAIKEPLTEVTNEGLICPGKSEWDAEYEVTAPKPLFVY